MSSDESESNDEVSLGEDRDDKVSLGGDHDGENHGESTSKIIVGNKVSNASTRNIPPTITLDNEAFSLAFHPSKEDVLAIGEINGNVTIWNFNTDENKKLITFSSHKKSCRDVFFSNDSTKVFTSSKDKSIHITDLNTGSVIHKICKAHEKAVNCLQSITDNFFASGSDDGVVKLWDSRVYSSVAQFSDNKDYISGMECGKERKHLLCTSGDGLLSVFNTRKRKLEAISDQLDEELLNIAIVKDGKKIVCGSSNKVIDIFSWGEWGDVSDRIPTDNESIDALCAFDEDVILTGADDCYIRCLSIKPNNAIGVIGKHGSLGIQMLKTSTCGNYVASTAGDNTVCFWNVAEFLNDSSTMNETKQKKSNRKRKLDPGEGKRECFFDDL